MPLYICRFCNKSIQYKGPYYYHLHTHISNYKSEFSPEELEEVTEYYIHVKKIKQKSAVKTQPSYKVYKFECKCCNLKFMYESAYFNHLISTHSFSKLENSGYDECFIIKLREYKETNIYKTTMGYELDLLDFTDYTPPTKVLVTPASYVSSLLPSGVISTTASKNNYKYLISNTSRIPIPLL
jgi:hypothetical protein